MCDSECGREGGRLRTDLKVRPYGMADRSERMATELKQAASQRPFAEY
jgi:hypothetical protein